MKRRSLLILIMVMMLVVTSIFVMAACETKEQNTPNPDDGNTPSDHVFGEWALVKLPTETTEGSIVRRCECGAEESMELPVINKDNYSSMLVRTATCDETSIIKYTITINDIEFSFDVEQQALGHDYGEPVYEWSADFTKCQAIRVCSRDNSHKDIAEASVLVDKINSTCLMAGQITYTALFNEDWAKEQIKTKKLPTLEHNFGAPTYEWSPDYTQCVARRICNNKYCGHMEEAQANVTNEKVEPNSSTPASITFTATFDEEWAITQTKVHTQLPNANHCKCGYVMDDNGFEYVLRDNGTYSITNYTGTKYTDVAIPAGFNGKAVTDIGANALKDCSLLTSITIPSSITSIGDLAFEGCNSLNRVNIQDLAAWCNIDFGGWSANPLKFAHNLYLNGELVANLEIPDSVTSIGRYAFYDCSSLTSVTMSDSVKEIDNYAFGNCSGLKNITIPNNVEKIGWAAFAYCVSLTSVTIPSSVTIIEDFAFTQCRLLTSLVIEENSKLTTIGMCTFTYSEKLESIVVKDGNAKYTSKDKNGKQCNCIIDTNTNTLVTGCKNTVIPDDIQVIGYASFEGCSEIANVTLPSGVTTIDGTAFYSCKSIRTIEIPDNVTIIGNEAFGECSTLESVIFTKNSKLTSIGESAFSNCTELTSIIIPKSVISVDRYAFGDCGVLYIYAEATSEPDGWVKDDPNNGWYDSWNVDDRPVYWYSETEPTGTPATGNGYWHYDADGVTPIIWEKKTI